MPKYKVGIETKVVRYAIIEAPSLDAAEWFAETCDESIFNKRITDSYEERGAIPASSASVADYIVDKDGDLVKEDES